MQLDDPEFWRQFFPDFHITNVDRFRRVPVFSADDLSSEIFSLLIEEGYFSAKTRWDVDTNQMCALVKKLTDNRLSTAFAFVYDEFWIPFMQLHKIYSQILGDYRILPDFWVWYVDPAKGDAGWGPHRDKNRMSLFADGSPKSLTTWIPLSQSHPLNGCMYIVPAMLDPTYNTEREHVREFAYQSIRALPCEAGDFFIWNQAVFHWGGQSSKRATQPRISMALEFQRADVSPFNQPLLNPLTMINFDGRIKLISKQILQYSHMHRIDEEMKQFAETKLNAV